jgi:molecular chaperone DnaK
MLTPSAILFDRDDIVIGREAARASVMEPDLYAECFKRDIGGSVYHRKIGGVDVPPEVLSALILERLKADAERRLDVPIRRVVITVPAFFDETRRKATQDAGRLAKLEVLDIINEPTAASVAYGYNRGFFAPSKSNASSRPTRVLVYDLGGGTFDVTILQIQGSQFQALATDGDVRLGGKDFDERLVDYLAEQFAAQHGADPRSDPQDAAQLWLDAQEAKHTLSERNRAMVMLFHAGVRMKIEVTRNQFEELIRDLIERTETTTSLVVKQAGLEWSQIDHVLLVGGSSRIPMVSDMLRQLTGKVPDASASPDEVVAHGAALYAATLMDEAGTFKAAPCKLQNINSHSLGVIGLDPKTHQRQNAVVIPKNTRIPCRATRTFKTAKAGQKNVMVAIVEGESHRPEECISLGQCVVRDLPDGLPKGSPIHVEFRYGADGRISVSASVPSVRQSAHVRIERDEERCLEGLDTWRARLGGISTTQCTDVSSQGPIDLNDRASVLRRIDSRHINIGKAAVKQEVPRSLRRTRDAAKTAADELERTLTALREAEAAKKSAVSTAEAVRFGSTYAQAKRAYETALTQSDFAYLVLGRECLAKRFHPQESAKDVEEIENLKVHVQD